MICKRKFPGSGSPRHYSGSLFANPISISLKKNILGCRPAIRAGAARRKFCVDEPLVRAETEMPRAITSHTRQAFGCPTSSARDGGKTATRIFGNHHDRHFFAEIKALVLSEAPACWATICRSTDLVNPFPFWRTDRSVWIALEAVLAALRAAAVSPRYTRHGSSGCGSDGGRRNPIRLAG